MEKQAQVLSDHAGLKPWSVTCIEVVCNFASNVATSPSERWTREILEWNTTGLRKRGRPAYTWETERGSRIVRPTNKWDAQIQMYCR